NTSSDVTQSVTWIPMNVDIATVTSTGLLSGIKDGTTTLTATKNGITSNIVNINVTSAVLSAITVTPEIVDVAKGQTKQLTATATYSDNTTSDITNAVTWLPTQTDIATITPTGLLSGVEVGKAVLKLKEGNVSSNTVHINVTAAVIIAITVTPEIVDVAKGQTKQLTATAMYSDNTTSDVTNAVTWMTVDPDIATVTPAGLLSGGAAGVTTLTAAKDVLTSNTVNVSVW
ncbi:MAG: Ig-like domain-containing protein, partial [Enterovibrio sp.]